LSDLCRHIYGQIPGFCLSEQCIHFSDNSRIPQA
jgi:hypothetical protein